MAGVIAGLQHAIRIGQEPVPRSEGHDVAVCVLRIRKEAEHHTMTLFDKCSLASKMNQSLRMPGVGDGNCLPVRVHNCIYSRHIRMFEVAAEDLIHRGEDPGGVVRVIPCAENATFTIDATSAAGTPWPETSATRIPIQEGPSWTTS